MMHFSPGVTSGRSSAMSGLLPREVRPEFDSVPAMSKLFAASVGEFAELLELLDCSLSSFPADGQMYAELSCEFCERVRLISRSLLDSLLAAIVNFTCGNREHQLWCPSGERLLTFHQFHLVAYGLVPH